MKKVVAAAFAVALAIAAAGCGDSGPTGSPAKSVTWWVMGNGTKPAQQLAAEYTKQSGVKISVQGIPWGQAHEKIATAVASGKGPDLLQVGSTDMAEFADGNALSDLTSKLGSYPTLASDKFVTAAAESGVIDHKTFAVPWITDTRVLYYRTDVLAAAGFDDPPSTLDEFKQVANKLAQRGKGKYGASLNTDDNFLPLILAQSLGGTIADGSTVHFDSTEFKAGVRYEHSFFSSGLTPKSVQADPAVVTGFRSGALPMFISGSYFGPMLDQSAPDIKGKWAVAPVPGGTAEGVSLSLGSNLAVFNAAQNVDGAMKLLSWLEKPATQEEYFKLAGYLPANKQALDATGENDQTVAIFAQQLESCQPIPAIPAWQDIVNEMVKTEQKINLSGAAIDPAVQDLQAKATQLASEDK